MKLKTPDADDDAVDDDADEDSDPESDCVWKMASKWMKTLLHKCVQWEAKEEGVCHERHLSWIS